MKKNNLINFVLSGLNSRTVITTALALVFSSYFSGCSSTPPLKTLNYAKLNPERTYEYEFPVVWKGIEEALHKHKIVDRDPKNVDALEMKKITKRTLETDWIYGQSRDKYQEYRINGLPKKVSLQTRFKYEIVAKRVMGGVTVAIKTQEEIEKLKSDGTSDGYSTVDHSDPSRNSELLDRIQMAILSAPPIN